MSVACPKIVWLPGSFGSPASQYNMGLSLTSLGNEQDLKSKVQFLLKANHFCIIVKSKITIQITVRLRSNVVKNKRFKLE